MNLHHHPFTLRQLQYVVAVADRGSFRGAASDCGVSQPSLSAQVALVEAALGIRLFDRGHRHVRVMPAAVEWLEQARRTIRAADALEGIAARFANPFVGTLRVGAIPTIAPYLLPEVAAPLRDRFTMLRFVWIEEKTAALLHLLEQRDLDAALLAGDPALPHLEASLLGHDPFLLAAPSVHPLMQLDMPPTPADLSPFELYLLSEGHCFRDQVFSFCNRTGLAESPWRATSLATLIQMTASGGGATLIPALAAPVENRRSALAIRRFADPQPSRPLHLVWRRDAAAAVALRALADELRTLLAAAPSA